MTGYTVVVLLVLIGVAGALALRRLRIVREAGVDVALRQRRFDDGKGWRLGIGQYSGDEFLWFRALGVTTKPDRVVSRSGLQIDTRRAPGPQEGYAMPPGATVLRCRSERGEVELAMGSDAMTGFLSWLEAAPPGSRVPYSS
ncbi:MAG: DUF2550 domain-containing protein [Sciscionella sp.]|nr:DUF2550 domain-containing protein [Sciscionella sp.]